MSSLVEYDLEAVLATSILEAIDPAIVQDILSKRPFIAVPGIFNIREVSSPFKIRPGLIFRSGQISAYKSDSHDLRDKHGIRTIFDLRTDAERLKHPSPTIDGIRTVNVKINVTGSEALMHAPPELFIEENGKFGHVQMYSNILELYVEAYRQVMLYLRDGPVEPILFHCTGEAVMDEMRKSKLTLTAGKDRTGLLAALILSLAGESHEVIAKEYALTRVGIEPARQALTNILLEKKMYTTKTPGMQGMGAATRENMLAALEMIDQKFGGVYGYLENTLRLSKEDIEKIKNNLRVA